MRTTFSPFRRLSFLLNTLVFSALLISATKSDQKSFGKSSKNASQLQGNSFSVLGGKVWLDANFNNQREPDEKGIRGVKLVLWKNDDTGRTEYLTPLNTTETDENGDYLFDIKEPGIYQVAIWENENFEEGKALFNLTNCKGSGDPDIFDGTDDNGIPGASTVGGIAGSVISAPIHISGETLQRGVYNYGENTFFASENGIDWTEKSNDGRFNFTCYATDEEYIYLKAHLLLRLPRKGGQCFIRYNENEEWMGFYNTEKQLSGDPYDAPMSNGTIDFGFQSKMKIEGNAPEGILSNYSSFKVQVNGNPKTMSEILSRHDAKSAYGQIPSIDFRTNIDNTIDVLWVESNGVKHLSRISLEDGMLVEEIPIPNRVGTGRFLGFEKLSENRFIIGYATENSFGQEDTEAWYTGFDKTGKELFSTRIWGDIDKRKVFSKGDPGAASSALIRYNSSDNIILLYLGHDMRWDDNVRHQGGWIGFLDGTTGKILMNGDEPLGNQWYFSHNFDQRGMLSSEGKFYTLAHGDAYPRALGIQRWSHTTGLEAELNYYEIKGQEGDNVTNTHTGDFVELADGKIAIVYSTEIKRKQRDLRVAIIGGMNGDEPTLLSENWVTENDNEFVGWGSKIIQYGNNLLVGWNTFQDNEPTGTSFALLNSDGKVIAPIERLNTMVLSPSQSFQKTKDGKNIVFISSAGNSLTIHMIVTQDGFKR
jgi:hypothetical protein